MSHFFCPGGCQGTSDKPGSCGDEACKDFRKPFVKCNCADGQAHEQIAVEDENGGE